MNDVSLVRILHRGADLQKQTETVSDGQRIPVAILMDRFAFNVPRYLRVRVARPLRLLAIGESIARKALERLGVPTTNL